MFILRIFVTGFRSSGEVGTARSHRRHEKPWMTGILGAPKKREGAEGKEAVSFT